MSNIKNQKNDSFVDDELNQLYSHFKVIKEKNDIDFKKSLEYQNYRKDWRDTALKHKITNFPLHLDIEVTSYCNLACPMCPRTHRVEMGNWENRMMKLDKFKNKASESITFSPPRK